MVVQSKESSKQSSLIDLPGGSSKSKNSKTNDLFAQLLSSINPPVKGEKSFGIVVDSKNIKPDAATKSNNSSNISAKTLGDLLVNEEKKLLPKELIDALSNDQVHSLIVKAKDFLKNSIIEKSPEYKADTKTLPKTLMGLVELADKMGIDMSEITLSTLDTKEKPLYKDLPAPLLTQSIINLKDPSTAADVSSTPKVFEALSQLINDVKNTKSEPKPSKESDKIATQPLQSLLKGLDTAGIKTPDAEKSISKDAPKMVTISHADALTALLRENNDGDTKEKKEGIKSLDEPTKTIPTPKADSIEVKSKEAVQSMRHFAIDLKEAAESYKPPFTRVTMKLNPEKLGEVEVTLVQRGNNVHVNIQSNNASSVAFLAHNATELKAQLAGQGITNATMNFMSGGENQQQNPNQQQHQQQPNRYQSYQSLAELETAQQELSALEIILPHYA
jgi:flagellar hook-length control protein FliK